MLCNEIGVFLLKITSLILIFLVISKKQCKNNSYHTNLIQNKLPGLCYFDLDKTKLHNSVISL